MTAIITGRRVHPTDDLGEDGFPWGMQRYDYGQAEDGVWWVCTPDGTIGPLRAHAVTEHDDGTISAQPSIATEHYHGYLDEGVWCGTRDKPPAASPVATDAKEGT